MYEILTAMFGFIWKQPIHQTLRQIRIVPILLIVSSQLLLWEIVHKLETLSPAESAMAYSVIAAALITSIWKGVDSLHKPNDKDPE